MATVVSQAGQGHYYVDYGGRIFKQSAELLSHVTERERLARGCARILGPRSKRGSRE